MHTDDEIEVKAFTPRSGRPMSWGERIEHRRHRHRASKSGSLIHLVFVYFQRFRGFLRSAGMTRGKVVVEGVIYHERTSTSLRRALSSDGEGVKEYDVRFPSWRGKMPSAQYPLRESMRIRYTARRIYADLGYDPRMRFVDLISAQIKPGDRVLEIGCGTGASSAKVGALVGPSGAVVAIHRDGESVRFARQRYRLDHLGFELGWLESLDGELDGSFAHAIAVDLFRDAPDDPSKGRAIGSLWRVVGEGGMVAVICSDLDKLGEITDRFEVMGLESLMVFEPDSVLGWVGAFGFRPKSARPSGHQE